MIDINEIDARYRQRLGPWITDGSERVRSKMDDALAHAMKAVTDALRSTPDGRMSSARIRANPSCKAAMSRLDELWNELGGPSVVSLQGFIQDAAESFYMDAREHWRGLVDPSFRNPSKDVTDAQKTHVRGLLLHGSPIRYAFKGPIQNVQHGLTVALNIAGGSETTPDRAMDVLTTWHQVATDRLTNRVHLALVDANVVADQQAMVDSIDPAVRDI